MAVTAVSNDLLLTLTWSVSGCLAVVATAWLFRRVKLCLLPIALSNEQGGAYTMSYVMVIPIYILTILTFGELSLMMNAKIGTVYASFAAARSAAVWDSAAHSAEVDAHVQESAIQAMAPFASGMMELTLASRGRGKSVTPQERTYIKSYREFASGGSRSSEKYVAAKYRYAKREVNAQINRVSTGDKPWMQDVEARVEYRYPFAFPILARILMVPKEDGVHYRTMGTTVFLQNELPKNEAIQLGISYASP